jgi:beta-lactamase regulating signal transducer with metallopeptidase domain
VILALFVVGILLLGLPGLAASSSRRFPVHEWVMVALTAAVVGALALLVGLVLTAAPLMQSVLGSHAIDYCRDALAPFGTSWAFLSLLAAIAVGVVAKQVIAVALRASRVTSRARIEPWLGEHQLREGYELAVVPTPALLAYGVPGHIPQVVLSRGLVGRLTPGELDAVIAHEAAHLRLNHPRMLIVLSAVEAAFGVVPLVHRSVAHLRSALEFWADSAAESEYGVTTHTLCAALVGVASSETHTSPAAAVGAIDRMQRLRRRSAPRPAVVRAVLYAPVAILMLVVATTAVGWFTDAHHALALGGPCH